MIYVFTAILIRQVPVLWWDNLTTTWSFCVINVPYGGYWRETFRFSGTRKRNDWSLCDNVMLNDEGMPGLRDGEWKKREITLDVHGVKVYLLHATSRYNKDGEALSLWVDNYNPLKSVPISFRINFVDRCSGSSFNILWCFFIISHVISLPVGVFGSVPYLFFWCFTYFSAGFFGMFCAFFASINFCRVLDLPTSFFLCRAHFPAGFFRHHFWTYLFSSGISNQYVWQYCHPPFTHVCFPSMCGLHQRRSMWPWSS